MSRLCIDFLSDKNINAIYFGLVASGYECSDIEKPKAVIELSRQIRNCSGLGDVKKYFKSARQKTCAPYPFWPRVALLESLTYFINDCDMAFEKYRDYVNNLTNLTEEEKNEDFFRWAKDFPKHLNEIKSNDLFKNIDKQIELLVSTESAIKESEAMQIIKSLNALDADINISKLSVTICPLKCVYSADYFLRDSTISIILGDFLPHSIVHEYMHLIVNPFIEKNREAILSLFGHKLFDIDQSYYLNNDACGFLNAFEEYIVRTASSLICIDHAMDIDQLIENCIKKQ